MIIIRGIWEFLIYHYLIFIINKFLVTMESSTLYFILLVVVNAYTHHTPFEHCTFLAAYDMNLFCTSFLFSIHILDTLASSHLLRRYEMLVYKVLHRASLNLLGPLIGILWTFPRESSLNWLGNPWIINQKLILYNAPANKVCWLVWDVYGYKKRCRRLSQRIVRRLITTIS